MKSIIVLSTYVDDVIKELNPDVTYFIFNSVSELEQYVSVKPLRGEVLFVTEEVMKPTMNIALTSIERLTNTPFFKVDRIEYLTTEHSSVSSIHYINERLNPKININHGILNRDFIFKFISGELVSEDITEQRIARVRLSKKDYLKLEVTEKTKELLDQKYISDEEDLYSIDETLLPSIDVPQISGITNMLNICGYSSKASRLFSILFAQYLSLNSKVVLIESDFVYMEITDYIIRSGIDCLYIDLNNLFLSPNDCFLEIKNTNKSFIFIGLKSFHEINYEFVINFIYSNLYCHVNYILCEKDIDSIIVEDNLFFVLENNVVDVIKSLHCLNVSLSNKTKFVALDMYSTVELSNLGQKGLQLLIEDLLQIKLNYTPLIFKVNTLKFGGEVHSMGGLVNEM